MAFSSQILDEQVIKFPVKETDFSKIINAPNYSWNHEESHGVIKSLQQPRIDSKSIYLFQNVSKLMYNILDNSNEEDLAKNFLDYTVHLKQFLNDTQSQDKYIVELIMKVSLKASENELIENNFRKYLQILFDSDFLQKRIDLLISTELYKSFDLKMLTLLISFIKLLLTRIPGLVYDVLYPRILNITLMVENKKNENEKICESILDEIQELNILANSVSTYTKSKYSKRIPRNIEPPDDFRQSGIFPTKNDLLDITTMEVFLRQNKVCGAYNSVDDYLDTQFRLLREDFIQPIREGINNYINQNYRNYNKSIKVYKNVFVINSFPCSKNGIVYTLKFDNSRLKKINWEYSKRFLFGSFLCLSSDHFQSFLFATVSDRNVSNLSNGFLTVKFDGMNPNKQINYTLIESTILFEPYKHVLKKLQETNDSNLPMKQYFVYAEKEISFPQYLIENIELKYEINDHSMIIGIENQIWPTAEDLSMDKSQFSAYKSALTNELTIIQGPPGTGKTFLGLAVCKTLMQNVQAKIDNFGPILIVCYTNHALDQFLEGILEFSDKIVRIGSKSKSNNFDEYYLSTLKKRNFRSNYPKLMFHQKIEKVYDEFIDLQASINLSNIYLIKLQEIKQEISKILLKDLENIDLKNWLFGHSFKQNHFKCKTLCEEFIETLFREEIFDTFETIDFNSLNECESTNDASQENSYDERLLEEDYEAIHDFNLKYKRKCEYLKIRTFDIDNLQTANNLIHSRLSVDDRMTEDEVMNIDSVRSLKMNDRWRLYRYWKTKYCEILEAKMQLTEENYRELNINLNEIIYEEDREIMMNQNVIGMTTTGAARYGKVLKQIKCKIVICEEAAEVLESHIIGSLNPGCEHLILIGDHKQLKPNPAVYELAKKYNLDLSLFERLIRNELPYSSLALQHRMRPEIAEIMKYIYPNLENHESVYNYPDVVGVRTNLFFLDHSEPECSNEERMSFSNPYEALFVMRFCQYLIQNGIENNKITILTLYSGQLLEVKRLLRAESFKEVRVSVVDNYQGEENDIILLSLVRSNEEDKIGFLNIENRICVSLSRAKHGLFVFGNFKILTNKSLLWKNICNNLKEKNRLGNRITVFCQNHPSKEFFIHRPNDFDQCPEGCCKEMCNERLNCGHACRMYCHILDKYHNNYQCMNNCEKNCSNGHQCPLKCHETCVECSVSVMKTLPICGHKQMMLCHVKPQNKDCDKVCDRKLICGHISPQRCGDEFVICKVIIKKKCSKCNHEKDYPCHVKPKCLERCLKLCDAGHQCEFKCFVNCEYCKKSVLKIIPNCNHEQKMECSQNPEKIKCKTMVDSILPCGHTTPLLCGESSIKIKLRVYMCEKLCLRICENGHPCKLKCYQSCKCMVPVPKLIPTCNHSQIFPCYKVPVPKDCQTECELNLQCGHIVMRECGETAILYRVKLEMYSCKKPCQRFCENGHPCTLECYKSCKCMVPVPKFIPTCNHSQIFPCYKVPVSRDCQTKCELNIQCGHIVMRECGETVILDSVKLGIYVCKKPCKRFCENDHPCKLECYKSCKCMVPVSKLIPTCNHSQMLPCYKVPEPTDCKMKNEISLSCGHNILIECGNELVPTIHECNKVCSNGHPCKLKCHEPCKCRELVIKTIPKCNHEQLLPCYKVPKSKHCKTKVDFLMFCGHIQSILCNEQLKSDRYKETFLIKNCKFQCNRILFCGHKCTKLCNEKCRPCLARRKFCCYCKMETNYICSENKCCNPCSTLLKCGHVCSGTCDSCNGGRLHQSCFKTTEVKLVCGHSQKVRCNSEVNSCQEQCSEACFHSKCQKLCFEDCRNCDQICSWSCPHFQCTNLCYQFCNRPICDKKCSEIIICRNCKIRFGCYGVCGEICENICPKCDPYFKHFKIRDLKNRKFIRLRTCGHTFDCEVLDKLMITPSKNGEIVLKTCPKCSRIINTSSCFRYSNISKMISIDIKRIGKFIENGHKSSMLNDFLDKINQSSEYFKIFSFLEVENYFFNIGNVSKVSPKYSKSQSNRIDIEVSNFELVKFEISQRLANELFKNFYNYLTNEWDFEIVIEIRKSLIKLLNWINPLKRVFDNFEMNHFISEFNRLYLLKEISLETFNFSSDIIEELKTCNNYNLEVAEKYIKRFFEITREKYFCNLEIFWHFSLNNLSINNFPKGDWFKCKKGHYLVDFNNYAECYKCSHTLQNI